MIAGGTVALLLGLLTAGAICNAYGQISGHYAYQIPAEIVEFCRMAIGSALFILTVGGIAEIRKRGQDNEKETDSIDATDVVFIPDLGADCGGEHCQTCSNKSCPGAGEDRKGD